MKKGLKLIAFGFIMMTALVWNVDAQEVTCNSADALKTCAVDGNTCKLSANIELTETIEIGGNVILDLAGYSIIPGSNFASGDSLFIVLYGGTLTVNDSSSTKAGKISTGLVPSIYAAIKMTKTGEVDAGVPATLVVNGGTIEGYFYAITGNGSRHNTVITINDGVLNGLNPAVNLGIYHPQDGKLTINGGTITGGTGIEMRSGELVVTGGTIIGTTVPVEVNPNGSGSTTVGAGIAIAQHNTKKDISVTISGGTIQGYSALYQSDPQGNDADADAGEIEVAVSGGEFEAINGGTLVVYSESVTDFISGGSFSSDVEADYVVSTMTTNEVDGVYYVGIEMAVKVNKSENGTVVASVSEAVSGQPVKLDIKANDGYKLSKIQVLDADGTLIEVVDGTFIMPDSEVTVDAMFAKVEANPETGDNAIIYMLVLLVAVCGFGIALKKVRKVN